MRITDAVKRHVMPLVPDWIKTRAQQALTQSGIFPAKQRRDSFGTLPANFIGSQWVPIDHLQHVTGRDFPQAGPFPWLDRPDAEAAIEARLAAGTLTVEQADGCRFFHEHGYYVAKRLIPEDVIAATFGAYLDARRDGTLHNENGDPRDLNPHNRVPAVRALLHDPRITRWIGLFLGQDCIPFQSIGSEWGSGQPEHSDAIHMTTYPLGYLVAAWVACEDVRADSGPLVYYPGSHRLPYSLSAEVGISPQEFQTESYAVYNRKYEPFIQDQIKSRALRPEYLLAHKGDVLFWHHNLIHGGSPIKDRLLTRQAIVLHYFADGPFCYHDLAGERAHLRQ